MSESTKSFNCTEMSRMVMCDEDYFNNIALKKYSPEVYADYTVYLVNSGVAPVENQDQQYPITNLYFGSRKVTDIVPVADCPKAPEYPNDKLYIQPKYSDGIPLTPGSWSVFNISGSVDNESSPPQLAVSFQTYSRGSIVSVTVTADASEYIDETVYLYRGTDSQWKLTDLNGIPSEYIVKPFAVGIVRNSGQLTFERVNYKGSISGYQVYFKHDDQVLPIASSLIADVEPVIENGICSYVGITWNNYTVHDDNDEEATVDDLVYTRLVTDEYVSWYFRNLSSEDSQALADSLAERIYNITIKPTTGTHYSDLEASITSGIMERLAWSELGGDQNVVS